MAVFRLRLRPTMLRTSSLDRWSRRREAGDFTWSKTVHHDEFLEGLRALAAVDRLKRAAAEPAIAQREKELADAEGRLAAAKAENLALEAELASLARGAADHCGEEESPS
jgi:hypothetical protein